MNWSHRITPRGRSGPKTSKSQIHCKSQWISRSAGAGASRRSGGHWFRLPRITPDYPRLPRARRPRLSPITARPRLRLPRITSPLRIIDVFAGFALEQETAKPPRTGRRRSARASTHARAHARTHARTFCMHSGRQMCARRLGSRPGLAGTQCGGKCATFQNLIFCLELFVRH